MKKQMTRLIKPALAISVAAIVFMGTCMTARAHDDHDSDSDQFFGSKALLTVFEDLYWRWAYGNGNVVLPTDQNGHAVVAGVALMPLPNAPGDGTPGSIDVTLKAGQPFFLPLIDSLGTSYTDGTADPFVDIKVFKKNLKLKLTLDGKIILDGNDAMDHYTQFSFDPPIPFNSPPVNAIIYSQGIGILHTPLSPGRHVIKLDVKLTLPVFNFTIEYHNTFNVTVQPKGH